MAPWLGEQGQAVVIFRLIHDLILTFFHIKILTFFHIKILTSHTLEAGERMGRRTGVHSEQG